MTTIKDVARAAGVSVATVSRVHNGSPLVTEATRRRVRKVATRLGYSPHAAARSLSSKKTNVIGVLLPDLYGEFYSELIRGIDQCAQERGFHLLVASSHNERAEIAAAVQSMRGRVDGLIVMSPAPGAHRPVKDLPATFPVLLLGAAGTGFDSITIANEAGAREMVQHLIAKGHRRIAMILGPKENQDAAERFEGYRRALAEAGIDEDAALHVTGDFTDTSGYDAARTILNTTPRATAIFAGNDAMAVGALGALRAAGIRIPEDMAVAGFDDIPMSRYTHPPLTTVRVDIAALGQRAAVRLFEAVANHRRHRTRREVVPGQLIIRASTESP